LTSLKRIMLQRIQTLYLLLSAVATGVLSFLVPLWTISDSSLYAKDENVYLCLFLASALLSIIAVFSFKSRQNQFVFGRLNIILNLILLGLFVYRLLNLPGALENAEKGIGLFLPVISIVLLVLANKAIKKDEALVKSVDRLR
jgi:ABC-type tungstate transport system substrate-binding protein